MSSKVASRADLLDRWRGIEEEEDDGDDFDPSIRRRLEKQKEQWFADAFTFLVSLRKENHIWCSNWDIMGPLLETFYNYFTDKLNDSPLRILWKRISEEMRFCIQCVCQHHQAQETYSTEYELCSIGPLLDVLQSLDEERVTQHLREINARLAGKQYDQLHDNAQVVSVMYEVLMYPLLLDDLSLLFEFEKFIEAVDDMHELTLDGHQQFPGAYALFFFSRRVRSVGHRLARSMGKLRMASDMEPLQPLLKKFISFLESEVLPSTLNTSRPRAQLERLPIWLGITSLLEFLEPPAFEEGILERYPIFLDIVLNHISGDLPEFSHVISCLKELFRMLGCKLWLRSTLSPSVMRNTLLGQCFHTRNEKIHKDIFDLFKPFLQSLEALQDGEHEKQRRHFLYFLLHQVPVSSNFSALTRKTACKIAFLIVQRGYQMNPPCPPFECAHMWGPSLVSSLKDSSLHHSLQQPAFDLIQTIVASDAATLIIAVANCSTSVCKRNGPLEVCNNVDENEVPSNKFLEEKDGSSWSELSAQSQIAYPEYEDWMCIPMLWICVLVDIDTSALPISLSKAVFWARSHFSMVELENGAEVAVDVRTWLSCSVPEISSTLGWKLPTGTDDGGQEQSKNSVRLSTTCLPLIKTFKRITTHFVTEFSKTELQKQWTWEPRMSESLILSLIDPNDNIRQFGKCMLEHVSNTRGLNEGLKFLCSNSSSLSAVFLGLKHVLKLICHCYKNEVHLDPILIKCQNLHHLFFVLRKLLKEDDMPNSEVQNSSDMSCSTYSSYGGFLRQPCVDSLHPDAIHNSLNIDSTLLDKFRYSLSEIVWPLLCKCLVEGRDFVDYSTCQMTCVRILEILPVLFEILSPTPVKNWSDLTEEAMKTISVEWLHDLMVWGRSKLKVILVYWRKAMTSLLKLFKGQWYSSSSMIQDIENLVSADGVDMDALTEKVSCLCAQWSEEASGCAQNNSLKPRKLHSAAVSIDQMDLASNELRSAIEKTDKRISDHIDVDSTGNENNLIVLSDDEVEKEDLPGSFDRKKENTRSAGLVYSPKRNASISDVAGERGAVTSIIAVSEKQNFQKSRAKVSVSFHTSGVDGEMKEFPTSTNVVENKNIGGNLMKSIDGSFNSQTISHAGKKQVSEASENVLKELVHDAVDDPLESAFKIAKPQQPLVVKSGPFVPKRQVIQLKSPFGSKSGNLNRLDAQIKRFKPPRLDAWYKSILEVDFFAIAGLAPAREDENSMAKMFQIIPVSFCSPEHYMNVFRPFVLEEFKAQLHSSFLEMSSLDDMYYGRVSVLSVERVDDFHLIRFVHDEGSASFKSFSENDLVLLTKERPGSTTHDVHMVGKVERRDRDNKRRSSMLLVRFYFQNGSQRLNLARRQLLERSKWHACRVMSITPQLREFQALSSLVNIPMHPILLNPNGNSCSSAKLRELDLSKLSQPLQQKLRSSYNDSQLQAISAAVGLITLKSDFDLSLIQGPPGTGKTKTILGIVSGLLASCHRKTNKYENSCSKDSKQSRSSSSTFRPKMSQFTVIARAWQDAAFARQLNEDTEKNEKSIESYPRGRVLICAQSNAAVDELVARICTGGLYGSDGKMYKPYIVRVGNAKNVHPNSLPFFIDTLVDHRLVEERNHVTNNMSAESSIALRSKLEKVAEEIGFYEAKRASMRDGSAELKKTSNDKTVKYKDVKDMSDACIDAKLRSLYEHKRQIYKNLSAAQAQERKTNEETKATRQNVRKSILREAEIVVTTLSGCGGDLYGVCAESISNCKFGIPSEQSLFDAVVIDEAAQALEPATLIPLQLLKTKGTKCIMVGDPKQLPATVLSNVASKYQFECSMFERVQRAGYPVVMLTKQYRMHPEICHFPSLHFYDNKLLNGENMSSKSAPFHVNESLRPYVFYDVADGQEIRGRNSGSFSLYNECEADAAVELLKLFRKRYPSEFGGGRFGIITPYKCQLSLLRSRFNAAFGSAVTADMEFNTVDGFQGREVDILILSTVRASSSSSQLNVNLNSIGFVSDVRRMNVALTRAKLSLWIFGNARTLQSDDNWAALLKHTRERNLVISVRSPYNIDKAIARKNLVVQEYGDQPSGLGRGKKCVDLKEHVKEKELIKGASFEKSQKFHFKVAHGHKTSSVTGDASANVESVSGRKKERRDQCTSPQKRNVQSVSLNSENKLSKDAECSDSGKEGSEHKRKECRERELKMGGGHNMSKKITAFENTSSCKHSRKGSRGRDANVQGNVSKGSRKSSESEIRGNPGMHVSTSETDGSDSRKGNYGGNVPHKIDTTSNLIAKRKEQRDAVDAILFSALIPSKKSESSRKSGERKRPSSPSLGSSVTEQPKKRKG